jgi:ketosteroid isomerase-like protein
MNTKDIFRLFKAIDAFDTETFLSFLSDGAVFRFGNMPPVAGKDNIRPFLEGFFQSIKAIRHDQVEVWEQDDVKLMNGRVTYTRHDGSRLTVYFANTFKMEGDRIGEYLIFVDTSRLYAETTREENERAVMESGA